MQKNNIILGIDEVGRGPLAGPLVVGACILPHPYPDWVDELNDSKKVGPKKRERLSDILLDEAPATATGWVQVEELDKIGMPEALRLATRRAVKKIQEQHVPFTEIIIDGQENFLSGTKLENYVTTIVKGDALIKEVSGASIIAKVARDNYMKEIALDYPGYGFEKHVGYGTPQHLAALKDLGPCPVHRQVKPVKKAAEYVTKHNGRLAERAVAEYLEFEEGHRIIARNYRTKLYEIDIISETEDDIYFTEVKYRKDYSHGSPLEMIDEEKQTQIYFAADAYMMRHDHTGQLPHLAVASVCGPDFEVEDWFTLG